MKLADLLESRRTAIVDRWTDLTLRVYPEDSARFMRREKDRFANPVGTTLARALEALYEGLLRGCPDEELEEPLDGIVRIRAVQDLPRGRALEFIFRLKHAIREELGPDGIARVSPAEVLELESRIDRLALQAFGLFTAHLQKLYELRVNEFRRGTSVLLRREEARAAGAREGVATRSPGQQ